jgi:hypothetical protein
MLAATLSLQAFAHDADAQDPRLRASLPERPALPSPVSVPLDGGQLAGLVRRPVTARVHDVLLQCEGVSLIDLLRASQAVPEGRLDSPHLARYVLADARDGYRVLFSLAELDPGTGNRAAYVVDRCGGDILGDDEGPLRLLVPDDASGARSVRQLDAITVVVAP